MAYDEASFFMVRLLQTFSEFALAPEAQPEESKPPWKNKEKVWFTSHLSLYFRVRTYFCAHDCTALNTRAQGGLWVKVKRAEETD